MKSSSPLRAAAVEVCLRAKEAALSLFYPPHCANCAEETPPNAHLCDACQAKARKIAPPCCERCSEPFDGAITGSFHCANCRDREFHFESAIAPYRGQGVVREFIHRFKYNRHFYLRHQLAAWMAEGLNDARLTAQPFDALVAVPLHSARLREREFNQAEVLGKLVARHSGKPLLPALRRIRYTTTQPWLEVT
jgi:predicted amidophosphoribosyltransferase